MQVHLIDNSMVEHPDLIIDYLIVEFIIKTVNLSPCKTVDLTVYHSKFLYWESIVTHWALGKIQSLPSLIIFLIGSIEIVYCKIRSFFPTHKDSGTADHNSRGYIDVLKFLDNFTVFKDYSLARPLTRSNIRSLCSHKD
jgi:hypothetical protein